MINCQHFQFIWVDEMTEFAEQRKYRKISNQFMNSYCHMAYKNVFMAQAKTIQPCQIRRSYDFMPTRTSFTTGFYFPHNRSKLASSQAFTNEKGGKLIEEKLHIYKKTKVNVFVVSE